ncbi:MAG: PASTA domain-containing protein [Ignavibacteriae bacterium]|nr:PASTA domain-containing protein [Ignavibacteriota bacterium]
MFGRKEKHVPDNQKSALRESLGRILIVKILMVLLFLLIAVRLLQVQVIEAPKLKELAKRQYLAPMILPATRGNIYDRNGKPLVSNTMYISFAADPTVVKGSTSGVARRFAKVFGRSEEFYFSKLKKGSSFVWLERGVKPEVAARIKAEELVGVIRLNEPKRLYHYGRIGGQLIGFTGMDYVGLSGIEFLYDKQLRGRAGHVVMQRDGFGRTRPSVDHPRMEPVNGQSIVLTIDLEYQAIAEEELRRGIERNKAKSGLVVMMDPSTGEVLAMANYPGIDPGNASRADTSLIRNRTITDMFEPGSVFKIVTASAALERDVAKPEQKFYAEQGRYVVNLGGGRTRTITDTHPHGLLTFQQGMEQSSNIVLAKISDLIGAELFYTTARNFGFGIATGVGLPGEVGGELKKPSSWSRATLNSMAYGYEVHVTPIQLAASYGVVANNGTLMKPYIVRQILNKNNEVVVETHPQAIRRVISNSTAEILKSFLVGAVERGTGIQAKTKGVTVAGKTGTSRKYLKKYIPGSYTASFAGFFPADDPQAVCLVMLDNPAGEVYTGGLSAAPIFRAIAEKVVATSERFTRKPQMQFVGKELLSVPDVTLLETNVAHSLLTSLGFEVEMKGAGTAVVKQSPGAGTKISRDEVVKLSSAVDRMAGPRGFTVVPDVRGLTLRRAINRLTLAQLDFRIDGSGIVSSQSLPVGEQVRIGTRLTLRCEPKRLTIASAY